MTLLENIREGLKTFLLSKVPAPVPTSLFVTGQRVKYIAEPNIVPEHVGIVIRTWKDRIKVVWDGFETGVWVESEAVEEV